MPPFMDRTKWIAGATALVAGAGLLWWMMPRNESAPDQEAAKSAPANPGSATGAIPLTDEQIKSLSLRFARAENAAIMPIATVPAMIAPPPNARVAVAAQLPGIVTRIFVTDGDQVKAGQPLASVASRDMVSLNADLARAQAQLGVARAQAQRTRQLSKEGIIAAARADEANAMLRQAEVDVREQARLIGMANGSGGGMGYTLSAPISGRISSMTIETGKALDQGMAPFVIDAANRYQARAQIPERLIALIRPGMKVRVERDEEGPATEGTVTAVGSSIDPATRSATLTASLPATGATVSGRATSLTVMGPAPTGAVSVPAEAVTRLNGATIVFVKSAKGITPRKVRIAEGGGSNAVLLSGVKAGEQVVISSISELKALAGAE